MLHAGSAVVFTNAAIEIAMDARASKAVSAAASEPELMLF
jgi:hypothetical protein